MNIIQGILFWLNTNQGVAQWLTFVIAIVALIYSIHEFILKRRPFIDVEIQVAENPNKNLGGWLFFGLLTNNGTYPGVVKISKTVMTVGDESYPASVKNRFYISPGEGKKSALIGSIYKNGIKKIKGHEYKKNRVEFEIEILSGEIGSNNLKYKTRVLYQVNVTETTPEIIPIEEDYS